MGGAASSLLVLLSVAGSSLPPPGELLELLTAPGFIGQTYGRLPLHANGSNPARAELVRGIWGLRQVEGWLAAQKHQFELGVDLDVSQAGERLVRDGRLNPEWDSIWNGFAAGGTLILNEVNRHPAIYELGTRLNRALGGVVASANTYVSPPAGPAAGGVGDPGFNWHFDDSDVLVLQHEGAKLWSICNPSFPLHKSAVVRDAERVLGPNRHCRNLTLAAGECLYLPFGSFHKAWPMSATGRAGELASVHTTVALKPLVSWQSILEKVLTELIPARCRAEGRFEEFMYEAYKSADPEASACPRLLQVPAVQLAVDNSDLPAGALDEFASELAGQLSRLTELADRWAEATGGRRLEGCAGESLVAVVAQKVSDKKRWRSFAAGVLDQTRIELVGKTPRHPVALPLSHAGPIHLGTVMRRPRTAPVALSRMEGTAVMAVMNTGKAVDDRDVASLRWALGMNDPATRRGRPFAIRDIPVADDSDARRLSIGKLLVGMGVVEMVQQDADGDDNSDERQNAGGLFSAQHTVHGDL